MDIRGSHRIGSPRLRLTALLLSGALAGGLTGCGESDSAEAGEADMGGVTGDGVMQDELRCDEASKRAIVPNGDFTCAAQPEFITIDTMRDGNPYRYDIFTYEASHPLATAELAFPCAKEVAEDGTDLAFQAPADEAEPCSVAGVVPWYRVKWEDAQDACEGIGWRLCDTFELGRTCGGNEDLMYTYGNQFMSGLCNVQEVYVPDGGEFAGVAPTGSFANCRSPEGAFDVNGNLWEWSADPLDADPDGRQYRGAGWKLIAQRHQDSEQACDTETSLRATSARAFKSEFVGFRCCREVQ